MRPRRVLNWPAPDMITDGVNLPQRFADQMGQLLGPDFPPALGLAVSGGGDSMAMLALAVPWARTMGIALHVATVDHGLRAESGAEAAMVAEECALLGVPHQVLHWQGWDGSGNTQMAARTARRDLIGSWRGSLTHVLFAHTQDDQAETVLMRLARGSGVEGLSGMEALADTGEGWSIVRPLLGTTRSELRHYIKTLKVPYVDDPSNEDPRFNRVKTRAALAELGKLGISQDKLVGTAAAMQSARTALEARVAEVAARCVTTDYGHLQIDRDSFANVENDTQLRLLAAALQWTAHASYRPRLESLTRTRDEVMAGKSATLHGCQIIVGKAHFHVVRELRAVSELTVPGNDIWDGVWRAELPQSGTEFHVACLGQQGLSQLIRPDNVPAAALYSLPALWNETRVIAAPGLESAETHGKSKVFRLSEWKQYIHS